jgi:hypothetical protein
MWLRPAAAAIAAAVLMSCGVAHDPVHPPGEAAPSDPVDELSQHNGEFCPTVMPRASRETYGFGDDQPAAIAPSLPPPQEAWVCRYDPRDVAPTGSNGAWLEWVRQDAPRHLDADELESFSSAIEQLAPPTAGSGNCTADLGPRYLVSYAYEDDLTGVVVDSYGCGEVRLTDDPFTTVPGEPSEPGTVAGVLHGPPGLFDLLNTDS